MDGFVRMPSETPRKPQATQHGSVTTKPKPKTGLAARGNGHLARHLGRAPALSSRDVWRAATSGSAAPVPHRGMMERLFGGAFSRIKAYFGRAAALDALGAKAATDGERVAFASHSPSPRQVAHELAHVVQMRGAAADGSRLSSPGSPAEREADRIADRAARGEPVSVREAAPTTLHRDLRSGALEVPHGFFRIDMTWQIYPGWAGEEGTIHYVPKPTAPDTVRIRLSQVVQTTNLYTARAYRWEDITGRPDVRDAVRTTPRARAHVTVAGDTLDSVSTAHFGSRNQADRIARDNAGLIRPPEAITDTSLPLAPGLTLRILRAVAGEYGIDFSPRDPAARRRTSRRSPTVLQDYVWPRSRRPADNHDGHKRGANIREAVLCDGPGSADNVMFRFETVARSDDIGLYYGTLWWQFEVDGTADPETVTRERYGVRPGISDTFRGALANFNRAYANSHTVVAGETLEEISDFYYQSRSHADDIYNANRRLIGRRNTSLRPGWRLLIPEVSAGAPMRARP
jgi:hypothetical protein